MQLTDETADRLANAMDNLAFQLSLLDTMSIDNLTEALNDTNDRLSRG